MDLKENCMRYEVLKAVNIKITAVWDMTCCLPEKKLFYPEDGGRKFLRNIGNYQNTASHRIRP